MYLDWKEKLDVDYLPRNCKKILRIWYELMCLLIFFTDSKCEINMDTKNPPQLPRPCMWIQYKRDVRKKGVLLLETIIHPYCCYPTKFLISFWQLSQLWILFKTFLMVPISPTCNQSNPRNTVCICTAELQLTQNDKCRNTRPRTVYIYLNWSLQQILNTLQLVETKVTAV